MSSNIRTLAIDRCSCGTTGFVFCKLLNSSQQLWRSKIEWNLKRNWDLRSIWKSACQSAFQDVFGIFSATSHICNTLLGRWLIQVADRETSPLADTAWQSKSSFSFKLPCTGTNEWFMSEQFTSLNCVRDRCSLWLLCSLDAPITPWALINILPVLKNLNQQWKQLVIGVATMTLHTRRCAEFRTYLGGNSYL